MVKPNVTVACLNCSLSALCVVNGLNDEELAAFEKEIETTRSLKKGDLLYRAGDPMRYIYAIKSGSFKGSFSDRNGNLQITGFYLPGEMLGFEGLENHQYQCDITALDDSRVCELPIEKLEVVAQKFPVLHREMCSLNSKRLNEVMQQLMLVSKRPVEERLAIFLLNVVDRYKKRGINTSRFHLAISRQDMANFLGMAPETLSRQIALFQKNKWVDIQNKTCSIIDIPALSNLYQEGKA